jgi:toxin ParE1/3/4
MDGIWIYVATQSGSTHQADQVLDSISKTLSILGQNPFAGRTRESDLRPGLRSFPSGNYVVFYQVKSGAVQITRVLHGKRDARTIFSSL